MCLPYNHQFEKTKKVVKYAIVRLIMLENVHVKVDSIFCDPWLFI